ncbi:hypothetical protein EDB80DRAFT_684018 [Ilyonectria destructans]|nr:hypothetical protein EDB80DRAFT_684018 [Ilyonectria destructans]
MIKWVEHYPTGGHDVNVIGGRFARADSERPIAALCAYDDQFLGKLMAELATDKDGIDLGQAQSARTWFEDQIPHDDSWISRLLFIFETLTVAFYVRQNSGLGLPPLDGLPRSPPGESSHGQEATECSYCLASGRRGQSVRHKLRECTQGGAEVIETRFGEAIYAEKSAPNTACHRCYLPKHLCAKWTRPSEGDTWVERNAAEWACQFGRHLLRDIITGLYAYGAT